MNTNRGGKKPGVSNKYGKPQPKGKSPQSGEQNKKSFSKGPKSGSPTTGKPDFKKKPSKPELDPKAVKAKGRYVDFKITKKKGDPLPSFSEEVRLNKYISNAGICSRREADVLIQTGVVSVNGEVITELGYKIKPGDVVRYDGETVNAETKRYVLLNKPKGFITTMDDPFGRKTVMSLVKKACRERIYPVGRLDRETTGLLLFTNDGDLAKKLTHPRYNAAKIYHVELNKPFNPEQLAALKEGVILEDGTSRFDEVAFLKETDGRELGVEIHSGKNRIVRRTFEALGYDVVRLDRVQFAGLTKKDLPRGMFRHLTEQEVGFLKMSK